MENIMNINFKNNKIYKIIFILPNIYECVNGVSNKYIKFIKYLSLSNRFEITVFTTFKKFENYVKLDKVDNLNIIKLRGLIVPFYKDIKIPIIDKLLLNQEIKDGNEIIIFNGEFFWIYESLKKIKKNFKNIKIYPTMHTDYLYYATNIYSNFNFNLPSCLNHLDHYLQRKIFSGIVVTGEKTKQKYSEYTENIFNANEVNLDLFNNIKIDKYDDNFYNIIYCGRISKEKNIEEILECCGELNGKYNFNLHIIGDGPFFENLKNIIDIEYKNIKSKIIFYGEMKDVNINNFYNSLDNRVFLFTSLSETFGKSSLEAGASGIPIFIKKSEVTDYIYINKKNAFIFNDKKDFAELFKFFIDMDEIDKNVFINETINNIKKYDQNKIFDDWINFLLDGKNDKNIMKLNYVDIFTFHGITKFINCSGNILSD
jgi:glycosyltransferase involved in cell wall biosynthesis